MSEESCITITFGDVAENHVGMEKIGDESDKGFDLPDLRRMERYFNKWSCSTEIYNLKSLLKEEEADDAYILIVRNSFQGLFSGENPEDEAFEILKGLPWDRKAKMYGRVVDKKARYNLCFAEKKSNPDYANGKGTVLSFSDVPFLNIIRETFGKIIKEKGENLVAEGNYYYDVKKCGIGFHGDAERKKVIALRFGESMDLCYHWYKNSERVGKMFKIKINHGDLYMMSSKATGTDWKKRKIFTLRHAAGSRKFTK